VVKSSNSCAKKKKRDRCDKAKSNCPVKCGRPYVTKGERMRVLDTNCSSVAVTHKPEGARERESAKKGSDKESIAQERTKKRSDPDNTRGQGNRGVMERRKSWRCVVSNGTQIADHNNPC
jgi:hypothetical protein